MAKDALGVGIDASLGPEGLSVAHQIGPVGPITLGALREVIKEDVRDVFKEELEAVLGELKRLRKEVSTLSQKIDHVQDIQVEERKAALARFTQLDLDLQDLKLELIRPGWIKRFWLWLVAKPF